MKKLLTILLLVIFSSPVYAGLNEVRRLKKDLALGRIPIASTSNTLTNGKVLIGNASGVAAEQTLAGDVTVDNSGTTFISTSSVVNADISGSAGIQFSKFENLSSAQLIVGSGGTATATAVTGDVTINSSGVTTIGAGTVETAMMETGLQPSHVLKFGNEVTWSGGGTTLSTAVSGALSTDLMVATIKSVPSEAAYLAAANVFKNNSAIFTLSAANTSNDAVITYTIYRAAP